MKIFGILLSFLFCFTLAAKEGGNGGGVYTCGASLELFDFTEARIVTNGQIALWNFDSNLSMKNYLDKALSHIKRDIPQVQEKVDETLNRILENTRDKVFGNFDIPFINDVTISVLDPKCYLQVANWHEGLDVLLIDGDIFTQMNSLNQAGLLLHEALYKVSRDSKVSHENSNLIRGVVAKVFSDEILTTDDANLIHSENAIAQFDLLQCDSAVETVDSLRATLSNVVSLCRTGEEKGLCSSERRQRTNNLAIYFSNACKKTCRADEQRKVLCEVEI